MNGTLNSINGDFDFSFISHQFTDMHRGPNLCLTGGRLLFDHDNLTYSVPIWPKPIPQLHT